MKSVFIDTSYIVALEIKNDGSHQLAVQHWQTLVITRPLLVTTSYIFDEVVTFFNSRNLHAKAVEVGSRLLNSSSVQLVQVDPTLFYQAWDYFKQHQDKSYSLTDCISFLVMRQQNLQAALTFDHHFAQAGFQKLP